MGAGCGSGAQRDTDAKNAKVLARLRCQYGDFALPFTRESEIMKQVAVLKAYEHLALATSCVDRLTLDNGFDGYEVAWSEFLSQLSRLYGKLEQGAKGCSLSEPWFGSKKAERKSDDLLRYLHHARNVNEHSLDYITSRGGEMRLQFPPAREVTFSAHVMVDGEGGVHVRNPLVKTPEGTFDEPEYRNPTVQLVPVRDRGVVYPPPRMHDSRPIVDRSPQHLAQLAARYAEAMMKEAAALPIHY